MNRTRLRRIRTAIGMEKASSEGGFKESTFVLTDLLTGHEPSEEVGLALPPPLSATAGRSRRQPAVGLADRTDGALRPCPPKHREGRRARPTFRFVERCLALLLIVIAACELTVAAVAQLAITEVMSEASGAVVPKRPDYWELTNFGSNRVDLTPYRWIDSAGLEAAEPRFFDGRSLGPGETMLLVRSNVSTTLTLPQVSDWWGSLRLPPGLQVLFYRGPGFSPDFDAVQLWRISGGTTTLVDRVDFFTATPGVSFTYDPLTGDFDTLSRAGVGGAWRAIQSPDIGSPGWTTGPVPLRVLEGPQPAEVDAGSPATFVVRAQGLPKPGYQWRRNDQPILGAIESTLTLLNVTPADAGAYSVVLDNGLETLVSPAAALRVNTTLTCARILRAPVSLIVTPGQDAGYEVVARGYPLPRYQWFLNGLALSGETNRTFVLHGVLAGFDAQVMVNVYNELCSTNAVASLTVQVPPDLRVTEVMAAASTNTTETSHSDWWELTNFGSNAVSLRGYRFDDAPGVLTGSVLITNDVVVQPAESIVLISDMTREQFVGWWGEDNLPEHLQIIPYAGNSFDLLGDALFLWNATASRRDDVITAISFVNDTRGVSLWFDSIFAEFGEPSVVGQGGAFRAVTSDDIGSPGWITNPPPRVLRPRILSVARDLDRVIITWKTRPGHTYDLESCDDLAQGDWRVMESQTAAGEALTGVDAVADRPVRCYRVVDRSAAP